MCRITQGTPRAASIFGHRPFTFYGAPFHTLNLISAVPHWSPTTPGAKPPVWADPLSLATTYGIDSLSFPPLTEMFHFSGYCELIPILFRMRQPGITLARLPHSEIPGSKRVCRYPRLIAAYHVLHRLLAPRHPLCALNSLFQAISIFLNYLTVAMITTCVTFTASADRRLH